MGSAFRSQGSRGKTNLQENWKRTDWVVELADDQIVRRNSHQQSQSMLSKISNLEEKLRKSHTMLQDATKKLELIQQSSKKLSQYLAKSDHSSARHKSKKPLSDYSVQYQRKQMISHDANTALTFVEDDCFKVKSVLLTNKETGELMSVDHDARITPILETYRLKNIG